MNMTSSSPALLGRDERKEGDERLEVAVAERQLNKDAVNEGGSSSRSSCFFFLLVVLQ